MDEPKGLDMSLDDMIGKGGGGGRGSRQGGRNGG
eukprot:CAMPEP_0118922448 /NCGR_PEP_ID=MMETSP1169-20130426/1372_1 /TAXON_ID=36882 /ORGANISM="Pyramimonas obovata, Strain CCMP722" /LENGTH=33 /DNA_ID= /DNA_START= /DNA_END= /DNA_ORIENTATION=